jgi:ribokinase
MIIVFGSINVDLVMRVAQHPRPGETVLGESLDIRAGGKGANQAVAAARVGGSVRMYGAVGRDAHGEQMCKSLSSAGVGIAGVRMLDDAVTGCATITVDREGQNAICVASGANARNEADSVPDEVLRAGTTVVTQMEVPPAENWKLLLRAKQRGARTLLNLAPAVGLSINTMKTIGDAVDVLIVNETEAQEVLALLAQSGSTPESDTRTLSEELDVTVIVTAGEKGAYAAHGRDVSHAAAFKVKVVDTTGAGDCFVGVLAAALDQGAALEQALHAASAAGSLACERVGAQEAMPDREGLARAIGALWTGNTKPC